ncbi:MAG: mannose-1-phosphate guanylyltransferase/mannose-6-phosphate isomerase [Desulfamplus sp.]|nr:mannose-1-phosphate guanylyltransferase/mannose-6-phosphate isomerase [Desulfamplus sp.]
MILRINLMIIPLVLAGGSGTRLWPLSRELFPKQLLNLTDDGSMLQNTISRLDGLDSVSPPLVVCNEEHRFMVAEQLRAIDIKPLSIILEPVGRNTAPAIAVGAIKALELFKDPVLLVLPADHVINNIQEFHEAVLLGCQYAGQGDNPSGQNDALSGFSDDRQADVDADMEHGCLITFGVIPVGPETGYGYIKKGRDLKHATGSDSKVRADSISITDSSSIKDGGSIADSKTGASIIERFVEKPDRDTAIAYVESREYFWNSGMFMFKASLILKELETHEPDMLDACINSVKNGKEDLDFFRLESSSFEKSRSESIDYAVMEKTDKGVIIPLGAGWNDLGSWDALWQNGKKDENRNVIRGDVVVSDVKNSYIHAQNRLIAAVGLEDHVIVETKDAVFVAPRNQVQDVKKLVAQLKTGSRGEAVFHSKVFRPWGSYETIDLEQRFQVKRITVKPGAKLSLQKHYHRAEHWTVVSGTAIVTKGDEQIMLTENESAYIPLGTLHRLENPGKIPLELIEVQSGSYLGEDDIVRFDDVYGRQK